MRTKNKTLKRRPVVLKVNLDEMIKKAEKNPRPGSCVVVDVVTDLMAMGREEAEKRRHKSRKTNK